MPKNFKQLDEAEVVTAAELIETMEDYIADRAAISLRTVSGLIMRVNPQGADRARLRELALQGAQIPNSVRQSAEDYRRVAHLLQ